MERIQVELADRCFGDRIGLRVPPRRADQLPHEQLVEVRIALPVRSRKRLLEDCKGIRDPVVNQSARPARARPRSAATGRRGARDRRAGGRPQPGRSSAAPQGRARPAPPPARPDRSARRARGVRYPTAASAAPWASERSAAWRRRDHERVGLWGDAKEVPRRTLRRRAGLEQQLSGRAVRGVSFDHVERLVDGAADDRVEELERILAPEEVEPNEAAAAGPSSPASTPARAAAAQLGPVAEDRGRAEEASASGGRRARRSRPREKRPALRFPAAGARTRRSGCSLPCNRVQHRADEERIAAGRRLERGAEGLVRLQTAARARALRSRHAQAVRANRGNLRIGDQLRDKRGIAALSLRRPRPATTTRAALPRAFASGRRASAGKGCPPSAGRRSRAASAAKGPLAASQ